MIKRELGSVSGVLLVHKVDSHVKREEELLQESTSGNGKIITDQRFDQMPLRVTTIDKPKKYLKGWKFKFKISLQRKKLMEGTTLLNNKDLTEIISGHINKAFKVTIAPCGKRKIGRFKLVNESSKSAVYDGPIQICVWEPGGLPAKLNLCDGLEKYHDHGDMLEPTPKSHGTGLQRNTNRVMINVSQQLARFVGCSKVGIESWLEICGDKYKKQMLVLVKESNRVWERGGSLVRHDHWKWLESCYKRDKVLKCWFMFKMSFVEFVGFKAYEAYEKDMTEVLVQAESSSGEFKLVLHHSLITESSSLELMFQFLLLEDKGKHREASNGLYIELVGYTYNMTLRNVCDCNKKRKTSHLRVVDLPWGLEEEKLYLLQNDVYMLLLVRNELQQSKLCLWDRNGQARTVLDGNHKNEEDRNDKATITLGINHSKDNVFGNIRYKLLWLKKTFKQRFDRERETIKKSFERLIKHEENYKLLSTGSLTKEHHSLRRHLIRTDNEKLQVWHSWTTKDGNLYAISFLVGVDKQQSTSLIRSNQIWDPGGNFLQLNKQGSFH